MLIARQPPIASGKVWDHYLPDLDLADLTEKEYRSNLAFGLLYKVSTARFSPQQRLPESNQQALVMQSSCLIHLSSSKR
nr:hypothetical protein [Rubripirellula sp.]